jgi:general secretion pathway protein B
VSYILDALRKVEEKREQEESPVTVTFSSVSVKPDKKRTVWPYVLAGALLLNCAFFAVWVLSGRQPEQVKVSLLSEAPSAQKVPTNNLPPPTQVPSKVGPDRKSLESAAIQKMGTKKETSDRGMNSPSVIKNEEQQSSENPPKKIAVVDVPPMREMPRERVQVPAVSGKIHNLSELPTDVRHSLPEFKISGHAYSSEGQTRVVRINDKILQEGQDLSAGLRLEEIVPEGVVLVYQGFRFRVNLK